MRSLILGLAMAVLVTARPELYKENEDFQYSRSSSDEGTKSGYYDAQRGNMGGNYERAHNMDNLAQHQMGGLMTQVQGELGDGSKTRSGNVFTSANSRGFYGSGHYDLSSLGNRNFQDGATFEGSQSQTSAANRAYESRSSSQNNARYSTNSNSYDSGHSGFGGFHSSDLQEAQNAYGAREYENGSQSGRSSRFYTQSGSQGSNDYEHSNLNQQASNGFGTNNRQSQIRVLVRPGTRVVVPVHTQATSGSRTASYYDQTENSDAEVLNTNDQQTAHISNNRPKHYESSYSYRKQWEKHDTKPVPLSTIPIYQIPANSELYDSSHHGSHYENENYDQASSQSRHHSNFNAHQTASSSQIRNQAESNSQQHSGSSTSDSNIHQSRFNSGAKSHSANGIGSADTKPKSYQSSYSYHKSWERQGDPYVIKPLSNGYDAQTSERLTDLVGSQNSHSFQNYGSSHSKSHQDYSLGDCVIECDPQNSRIRIRRSVSGYQQQNQNTFDGQETQQSQNGWNNYDLGQQTQNHWENLEDLGQRTQQYTLDNLQDLGQQTQNKWDNLEDLGQQTQDLTQQTRQPAQDFGQQLHDFGQQTQDFGQQNQYFEQQTPFGQHTREFEQQPQDIGQHTQDLEKQGQDFGHQVQNNAQLNENKWDVGQETQNSWNDLQGFGQQSESLDDPKPTRWDKQEKAEHILPDEDQQTQKKWNQYEEQSFKNQDSGEGMQIIPTQSSNNKPVSYWDKINVMEQTQNVGDKNTFEHSSDEFSVQNTFQTEDEGQQAQGIWNNINSFNQIDKQPNNQKPLSLWDKIDSLDNDYIGMTNNQNAMDVSQDHFLLTSSQNSQHDEQQDNNLKFSSTNNSETNNQHFKYSPTSSSTTESNSTPKQISVSTTEQDNKHDIGRGDIGPDDVFNYVKSTTENNDYNFNNKPTTVRTTVNNRQIENEGLNLLTLENKDNTHSIQNTHTNQNSLEISRITTEVNNSSSTELPILSKPNLHKVETEEVYGIEPQAQSTQQFVNHNNFHHEFKDIEPQNIQSFGKSESWEPHQTHNLQHESEHQNFYHHEHGHHHHQHTFHQFNGFNDKSKDDENNQRWDHDHPQYHNNDYEQFHNHDKDLHQDNIDWKNMREQFEGFEEHQGQFSQQHDSEQQFEDFNQQSQQWNVEQQNLDQFNSDFSQQNQEEHNKFYNFEQKDDLEDLGQHEGKSEFDVVPAELNHEQQHTSIESLGQQEGKSEFDVIPAEYNQGQQRTNMESFGQQEDKSEFDVIPVEFSQELSPYSVQNNEDINHANQEINKDQNIEIFHGPQHQIVDEAPLIKKHESGLSEVQPNEEKTNKNTPLPESTSEKPGFWKSVGNKFASAKSKVASWFGS